MSASPRDRQEGEAPTMRAVIACGQWLAFCLSIGWRRDELDALESLWWKYHDRTGQLISAAGGRADE